MTAFRRDVMQTVTLIIVLLLVALLVLNPKPKPVENDGFKIQQLERRIDILERKISEVQE